MQATTFNYAQDNTVNANSIVKTEATQKIIMFASILLCLVAAVNL